MHKNLLLIFLFLFIVSGSFAQLVSSNSHVFVTGSASTNFTGSAVIKNTSQETLSLEMIRVQNKIPMGWYSAVGYGTELQSPFKNSLQMILSPGESARIAVQFFPEGLAGNGTVELQIRDLDNPELVLNQKFTGRTRTNLSLDNHRLSVFPNPADSYFKVADQKEVVKKVQIYNIVGRLVTEYEVSYSGQELDVSKLSRGIFLVRLLDGEEQVLVTQRLNIIKP